MMLSRCLSTLALLVAGTQGIRRSSRKHADGPLAHAKFIGGVPVLNYQAAYETSLAERQGDEEAEWVVVVNRGTTQAQMEIMCKANTKACNLQGHANGGVPFFEMRGTEQDLESVIRAGGGAVKYVEPDQPVFVIPGLQENVEAATWGLDRIGADQRSSTGAGVSIFVLDTGVRVTHEEFGGRASAALDMSNFGFPEVCNGNAYCAADRQGHGTHCAGTASGQTYGVAPSASVQAVKVLDDTGSGAWSWTIYALDWVATNTARPAVASMSLGGPGNFAAIVDAVDGAVNAGVTVVVAAGNDNSDACGFSPAYVPSAITVGSTSSLDARSYFSNYGSCVDIWAPGSSVLSAYIDDDTSSRYLSGTSMACPHVAGAAALVLEKDPSKMSSKVLQELMNTAEWDALTALTSDDTNALLSVVGGGSAPGPSPPPPSTTQGPAPSPSPSTTLAPTPPSTPAPTTSAPTPVPSPSACPSFSSGPDENGDCKCNAGLICYEMGSYGCRSSRWTTTEWFFQSCHSCVCQ